MLKQQQAVPEDAEPDQTTENVTASKFVYFRSHFVQPWEALVNN